MIIYHKNISFSSCFSAQWKFTHLVDKDRMNYVMFIHFGHDKLKLFLEILPTLCLILGKDQSNTLRFKWTLLIIIILSTKSNLPKIYQVQLSRFPCFLVTYNV